MDDKNSCRCSGLFSWFSLFLESFFNYFNATVKANSGEDEGHYMIFVIFLYGPAV